MESDRSQQRTDAPLFLKASDASAASGYATTISAYRRAYKGTTKGKLPYFPPPVLEAAPNIPGNGKCIPSTWATPFVTKQAGSLPYGPPCRVEELCSNYLVGGMSKHPPNIDINLVAVEVATNNQAKRALLQADAAGTLWWGAFHVPTIRHPPWWPVAARAVPGFEHMIVGIKDVGIGMHRDRYCGFADVPLASLPRMSAAATEGARIADGKAVELVVSTYLSLGRGRKHVILLPPTEAGSELAEALGGCGCDDANGRKKSQRVEFPIRPPPEMLEKVLAAGGFWFDIAAGGFVHEAFSDATEEASPAEENHEEEVVCIVPGSPRPGEAAVEDGTAGHVSTDVDGEVMVGGEEGGKGGGEEGGKGGGEDDKGSDGASDTERGNAPSDGDSDEDGNASGDSDESEDDPDPVTIFLPAGWWHWLSGDSDFHVAWSGSFFPGTTCQPERMDSNRSGRGGSRGMDNSRGAKGRGKRDAKGGKGKR